MRTLVEQTFNEIDGWLKNADLLHQVGLHKLMGGAVSQAWDALPDQDCILVGTQDQLLSRALNRGYSMSRYRWPIHFALLNNDCLWVMDETQLMGAGLQTTAQLQGFRNTFKTYGTSQSLWMSATLDRDLLNTVDHLANVESFLTLSNQDWEDSHLSQRLTAKKPLTPAQTQWTGKLKDYAKPLAQEVAAAHIADKLTLVICNRVDRAQAIQSALADLKHEARLIHSRFRPKERSQLNQQLQASSGIWVATQAIEAGVDIDAAVLFTELAPWSSLVQRFGRCNRRGVQNSDAQVYWIDTPDLKKKGIASPYEPEPLDASRQLLNSLEDVGYVCLNVLRQQGNIPKEESEGLIPRRRDLLQLFDTSADLAGHDIDVSSFIRDADDSDVLVTWRDWGAGKEPPKNSPPLHQAELCRVPLYQARDLIKKLGKQTIKRFAWTWSGLQGEWVKVQAQSIYPGMTLLLHCQAGGYSEALGFTGNPKHKPTDISPAPFNPFDDQLDADNRDPLTATGQYITLKQHGQDVAEAVQRLCDQLSDYDFAEDRADLVELLVKAGRWHDLGKAHVAFQEMLTQGQPDRQERGPWAKSNQNARMSEDRRGFRHELVSALVALQENQDFLLAYLVACHHGKVRMTIQPRPTETPPQDQQRYALGVREGDEIDGVDLGAGIRTSKHQLSLACMEMGASGQTLSWTAQAIKLLETFGPFRLAFLESLIRLADWQVSREYNRTAQAQEANHGNT